jgi:hypothetical protein
VFNFISKSVEASSREKAKANRTYCAKISHGMRIYSLRGGVKQEKLPETPSSVHPSI